MDNRGRIHGPDGVDLYGLHGKIRGNRRIYTKMDKIRINKKADMRTFWIGLVIGVAILFLVFSIFGKGIYRWLIDYTPEYNDSTQQGGIQLVGYDFKDQTVAFYDTQYWIPIEKEKAYYDKVVEKDQIVESIEKRLDEKTPASVEIREGRNPATQKVYRSPVVIEDLDENGDITIWHSYREEGQIKIGYLVLKANNRLYERVSEYDLQNMPVAFVTNEGKIKATRLTEPYMGPIQGSKYSEELIDELNGLDFPSLTYSKFFGENPDPDLIIKINDDFQFVRTSTEGTITYILKKRGTEVPVFLTVESSVVSDLNEDTSVFETTLQEEGKIPYAILEVPIELSNTGDFTKDITSTNPSDPEYDIIQKVFGWKKSLFAEPLEIEYTKKEDRKEIPTSGEFCLDIRPERAVIDFNKPGAEAPCPLA